MKKRSVPVAFFLSCAVALWAAAAPVSAAQAGRTCPEGAAQVENMPRLTLPQSAKTTSPGVGYFIDVGSDGRVRDMQLAQSSGDVAVDALVRETLSKATYRPARSHCVAYSDLVFEGFTLGDASPAPLAPAEKRDAGCVPFVDPFITPIRSDPAKRGTAIIAVDLDAAGSARAVRLQKGTGSAVLDTEALRIAQSGNYHYSTLSRCSPQPSTYFLELRFE